MSAGLYELAKQNLVDTYCRLGLAEKKANISQLAGMTICTSPVDHPMSNFAIFETWTKTEIEHLKALMQDHPSLRGYFLAPLEQAKPDFARADFWELYELVMMAHPKSQNAKLEPLYPANTTQDRSRVATFIIEQFFKNALPEIKDAAISANSLAEDIEIYSTAAHETITAAIVLSPNYESLGIYSLCVSSETRQKGLGTRLVRWALAQGFKRDLVPTLQCSPDIESWYFSAGFEPVGRVHAVRFC